MGHGPSNENSILNASTFHLLSRQPVQHLLGDWKKQLARNSPLNFFTLDQTYESRTQIGSPFSFHRRLFESREQQRARMKKALDVLAIPRSKVLLVSHGGRPWTDHGESVYCSNSIYRKSVGSLTWTPLTVDNFQLMNGTLHVIVNP